MPKWTLNRLFDQTDQPKPRFALQGTVNWMRALAILVDGPDVGDETLERHYRGVQRRVVNEDADTRVFENVLMAFHNLASVTAINADQTHKYDVVRSAIISWYYTIYFSASAMVAAASGANPDTHASTAKVWQSDIVQSNLTVKPFSLFLSSLVIADVEKKIQIYRGANQHDLNVYPQNKEEAWGCVVSYLNGTADYEKCRIEDRVRSSREFAKLGVADFRKKVAIELRDRHLSKGFVNFIVQSFRYRGKANYRDSIFLSYGDDRSELIDAFTVDLVRVAYKFLRMTSCYVSRRVERGTWDSFLRDLEEHSRISVDIGVLRV